MKRTCNVPFIYKAFLEQCLKVYWGSVGPDIDQTDEVIMTISLSEADTNRERNMNKLDSRLASDSYLFLNLDLKVLWMWCLVEKPDLIQTRPAKIALTLWRWQKIILFKDIK